MTLNSLKRSRLENKMIYDVLLIRYNSLAENGVEEKDLKYLKILWNVLNKFKDDQL